MGASTGARPSRDCRAVVGGTGEEEAGMEVMTHASTFLLPSIPAAQGDHPAPAYALVVLNQRLPTFAPLLWKHGTSRNLPSALLLLTAQLRVCADGGANRVHDEMPLMFPHDDPLDVRKRYTPDIIKGDMDSIREEVKEFYFNLLSILVTGALGGRFDHEVGNINVLYRFSNLRIILLSDDCLIYLLPKTHHHEILVQSSVEGPHCGLIPIGGPSASTTTTGLQWDLNNMAMNFGGLVSTSNIVRGEKVTVRSDSDLLWTISLRRPT
ncbi:hypothetical protein Taro_022996 [Colocasia esculenta]|uniref:thiamine diphosphokinase n=1 Tax=Colocasia esculenta TaxID=4460 RepID=A0A843VG39_COLES|nr:hypothetical protein [Colocasia esculenta]